jgi:hypothetical protein
MAVWRKQSGTSDPEHVPFKQLPRNHNKELPHKQLELEPLCPGGQKNIDADSVRTPCAHSTVTLNPNLCQDPPPTKNRNGMKYALCGVVSGSDCCDGWRVPAQASCLRCKTTANKPPATKQLFHQKWPRRPGKSRNCPQWPAEMVAVPHEPDLPRSEHEEG